jgi:hypothetical protein
MMAGLDQDIRWRVADGTICHPTSPNDASTKRPGIRYAGQTAIIEVDEFIEI